MKKKTRNKKGGRIKMILLIIVTVIVVLLLIGTILHATYYAGKRAQIQPYGQMADVYDGQMHIYKMGDGDKTIVLLPGLGVALPCADFGPLMRELSEEYTVVCVEYFGMGFSTQTGRERTCENYVEEIRSALSQVGIKAPYVLMSHSISSIYSEFYAAEYPQEVEAIISLDGTSSAYIGEDMPGFAKALLGVSKLQQATGLTSVIAPFTVNRTETYAYGYTEKEIDDMIAFAGFTINDIVLDQLRNSATFIKATNATTYPASIPYIKIISKQTYETKNDQIKISSQEYQKQHLSRVGAENNFEILDGTHFIYQNNAEKIKTIATNFLFQPKQK